MKFHKIFDSEITNVKKKLIFQKLHGNYIRKYIDFFKKTYVTKKYNNKKF